MLPYYYCPFTYIERNIAGMPQQTLPFASPAIQPAIQSPGIQAPGIHMPNSLTGQQVPVQEIPQMMPQTPPVLPQQQSPVMAPDMHNTDMYNYNSASPVEGPNDPPPVLSNNPPVTSISLFKELTAHPNYGNPSGNADILYTGNRGTWTFDMPVPQLAAGNLTGRIVIRGVLDDMEDVPVNRYSARITVNGTVVHNGRVPLEHGRPLGGKFNNWRELTFNIPNLRRNNRVIIENTSSAGPNNWIALDWMELILVPRR